MSRRALGALACAFALAAGCGSQRRAAQRQDTQSATDAPAAAASAVTPSPPATPTSRPQLPNPVRPRQGAVVWAVYFAAAKPGAPELDAAVRRLESEFNVATGPGNVGCDEGAAEALRVPPEYESVALYFASESDARRFAAALQPPAVGVVKVRIGCPD